MEPETIPIKVMLVLNWIMLIQAKIILNWFILIQVKIILHLDHSHGTRDHFNEGNQKSLKHFNPSCANLKLFFCNLNCDNVEMEYANPSTDNLTLGSYS
jgi:hypothetical protein